MIQRDYLIIGAGIASGSACESLREHDRKGTVTLVGAESFPPYHRPQLFPSFLGKKEAPLEKLLFQPPAWWQKHKIELRLDTAVTQLNLERHLAVLSTGQTIEFRKALLATGSRARRPQVAGANLGNVFYLRGIRDLQALREMADIEKGVVILGGGLIGAEVAARLRQLGKNVTLITRQAQLWQSRLDAHTAAWLTDYFRAHGVNLLMQESLNGFEGKTVLRNIQTKSGQRVAAGVAIVAQGAEPNLDLVLNTPLASPQGTPVNEYLETDEKGIFAAGDITLYPDRIFGGVRRIEHWENAVEQGRIAGMNITGKKRQKFEAMPYYASWLFDLHFEFIGDTSRPPSRFEIIEGDPVKKKFVAKCFQGTYLMAMVLCNQTPERSQIARQELRDAHA
jgi:3-phenylpropionate/trans-cinnamate dioxygenase ferredoxin reductase subunit